MLVLLPDISASPSAEMGLPIGPPLELAALPAPSAPAPSEATVSVLSERWVVVHATIRERGELHIVGDAPDGVDVEVLRVVARELAFPRQLRCGTPLEIVYEVRDRGPRLAALSIGSGTEAKQAFYFRAPGAGLEGFFGRDGSTLEHRFLRYPLTFDRVTSGFSSRRPHPILQGSKPHNGVDFAARPGTPVHAVGSGKIIDARWHGRYGRTIRVEHDGGFVSGYAHLQGFAAGVRVGAAVRKGQIIGYVGVSGLTTGPHLHFSVARDGRYLDPLGRDLPKRPSLDESALVAFRQSAERIERAWLAAANEQSSTLVASRR
jgi:murein DD-endopeptidase MepM/ murein hydrolase activator NlpD